MDSKLTLKLDKLVIEKAKEYAASQNRSLSDLIESYLKIVTNKDQNQTSDDIEISPYVKSMKTGINIAAEIDCKKAYGDYLEEKYR